MKTALKRLAGVVWSLIRGLFLLPLIPLVSIARFPAGIGGIVIIGPIGVASGVLVARMAVIVVSATLLLFRSGEGGSIFL